MAVLNFPITPALGDVHNAANGIKYEYDGTKWKGQGSYTSGELKAEKLDSIASGFNGSTATFTLNVGGSLVKPHNPESILISIADVIKEPTTDYTVSSTNGTITFTGGNIPTSGQSFWGILYSRIPVGSTTNLQTTGGTLTGALTLSGAPTADLHASTKKYVDDQTTSDIAEGSNKYYTDARADARVAASSLSTLSNVASTSPSSGQVLKWDGSSWGPATGAQAGINDVVEDTTPQLGGSLDVNGNSIVSASNGNIPITPNGSGKVILDGLNWPTADGSADYILKTDGSANLSWAAAPADSTKMPLAGGAFTGNITLNAQNDIRFADADSSNWVALQAPGTVSSNVTWTLPATDGSSGQQLTTDGSGALSWAAAGGTDTNTTYSVSCVDGDNTDEEKIRLTAGGDGSGTDDIVLEAGTGLSIARSGDKITFTNTVADTTLNLIDEDNMATDSATRPPSQQSVKAYVDTQVATKQASDAELTELATMASGTAGALADLTQTEVEILDGATVTTAELNILDGVTSTAAELNILDGVTSTAAELNILDGVTSTAAELNILDGVTSTAAELNLLDGVTATTAELNYTDGVTSNIQTQLNAKGAGDMTLAGAQTVTGVKTFNAAAVAEVTALTDASTVATDLALSNNFSVTLAGNRTLGQPTNQAVGQSGSYFITQDGTGSRTLAYHADFKWVGGTAPTLTTTAGAVDRIDYIVAAANKIHAVASLDVK